MEELSKHEVFAKEIIERAAMIGLTVGEFRTAADLAKRIVNDSKIDYGVADDFDFRRQHPVVTATEYINRAGRRNE